MGLNAITAQIIDSSMKVHNNLGPGLQPEAYEVCLAYELRQRGLDVVIKAKLPLKYEDVKLDFGCRVDLFVESRVMIKVVAVEETTPLHESQLLAQLKQGNCRVGLLLNFDVYQMKDGIKRVANEASVSRAAKI